MNAVCWNGNAKEQAEEALCRTYGDLKEAKEWLSLAHIENDGKRKATDNDIDRALSAVERIAHRLDINIEQ